MALGLPAQLLAELPGVSARLRAELPGVSSLAASLLVVRALAPAASLAEQNW